MNRSGRSRRARSACSVTQSLAAPEASTGERRLNPASSVRRAREVHRPPVVRVDQRVLPQLGALVDVGHARHGQLDQLLAERVRPAGRGDQRVQLVPGRAQPGVVVRQVDRRVHRRLEARIRRRSRWCRRWPRASPSPRTRASAPARSARPRPGSGPGSSRRPGWAPPWRPGRSRRTPPTRSGISASTASRARTSSPRLVSWVDRPVIDSGCRCLPLGLQRVELRQRDAELPRVAAHLVQGDEPGVAVVGGVLDALGHGGAAELLHPHGPARRDGSCSRGLRAGERPRPGPAAGLAASAQRLVQVLDAVGQVGAVDLERHGHLGRAPGRRPAPRAPGRPSAAPRPAAGWSTTIRLPCSTCSAIESRSPVSRW